MEKHFSLPADDLRREWSEFGDVQVGQILPGQVRLARGDRWEGLRLRFDVFLDCHGARKSLNRRKRGSGSETRDNFHHLFFSTAKLSKEKDKHGGCQMVGVKSDQAWKNGHSANVGFFCGFLQTSL